MFEISQLKVKTLVELQDIAKKIGAKKYSQLKKLDLVYLILDIQAAVPPKAPKKEASSDDGKPRRRRIIKKAATVRSNKPQAVVNEAPETVPEPKSTDNVEPKKVVKRHVKAPVKNTGGATESNKVDQTEENSATQQKQPQKKAGSRTKIVFPFLCNLLCPQDRQGCTCRKQYLLQVG